jgi:hypothetical protein
MTFADLKRRQDAKDDLFHNERFLRPSIKKKYFFITNPPVALFSLEWATHAIKKVMADAVKFEPLF